MKLAACRGALLVCLGLAWLVLAPGLESQTNTGTIVGTVSDATGAVVQGLGGTFLEQFVYDENGQML